MTSKKGTKEMTDIVMTLILVPVIIVAWAFALVAGIWGYWCIREILKQ